MHSSGWGIFSLYSFHQRLTRAHDPVPQLGAFPLNKEMITSLIGILTLMNEMTSHLSNDLYLISFLYMPISPDITRPNPEMGLDSPHSSTITSEPSFLE